MGKKQVCPIGLVCFDSKYIFLIFLVIISILICYIHSQNKDYKEKITEVQDKFLKTTIHNVNKKNLDDVSANDVNTNTANVNSTNGVNNINDSNNNFNRKVVVQTQDSYLINKDYERVINPLLPPERRNHYIDPHSHAMVTPGVPINIPTRGYAGGVVQVGALYKQETTDTTIKIGDNNEPVILPLFGMPTYNGSNKWMYYTATDKFNQIKIPITNKNRECNLEYGCDELYDGDIVTIPAYNGDFKVSKYQFDKPRYIPHIL